MTDIGEFLGRATATGGRYEVPVSGGTVGITGAEIGDLLAGVRRGRGDQRMSEGAYRLLLLRYAGGTAKDLHTLIDELVSDARPGRSAFDRISMVSICRAAAREFILAGRCPKCEGRQTTMAGNLVQACPACYGTGYRQHTAKMRADELGIPPTTFRKGPVERRYLDRLRRLVEWEDEGLRMAAAKQRGGRDEWNT